MAPLSLPIQAAVDREAMLQRFVVDTPVIDPTTGKVLEILRNPINGSYGPEPNDPSCVAAKIVLPV